MATKDTITIIGGLIGLSMFVSGVSLTWGSGNVRKDIMSLTKNFNSHVAYAESKYEKIYNNERIAAISIAKLENLEDKMYEVKEVTTKIYDKLLNS